MTRGEFSRLIDHTQVHASATQADITRLCQEAVAHGFPFVSVNPAWTSFCVKTLDGSGVGVNPTIGFPLGATTAKIKVEEAREAVKHGAAELDMVINIGALKSGFPEFVEKEIAAVVKAAGGVAVKIILETSYLSDEEKVLVCEMSERAGAAFVKTCTGFGDAGATVNDVRLMRQTVGKRLGVKAAGGIRDYRSAKALIDAGASRIGTSSALRLLAEIPESD